MRQVRSYRDGDAKVLGEVFHKAIRGATEAYGAEGVAAWSPAPPTGEAWAERLGAADTVLCEEDGKVLGFMSLVPETGLLDLAFVLPEVARSAVASGLYAVLEGRARARGQERLTTEASLLAEPFFSRLGWQVVKRQRVERRGVLLKNCVMEKRLSSGRAAA